MRSGRFLRILTTISLVAVLASVLSPQLSVQPHTALAQGMSVEPYSGPPGTIHTFSAYGLNPGEIYYVFNQVYDANGGFLAAVPMGSITADSAGNYVFAWQTSNLSVGLYAAMLYAQFNVPDSNYFVAGSYFEVTYESDFIDLYVSGVEFVGLPEGPICAYQDITFRAHIYNDGTQESGAFGIEWNVDGQILDGAHNSIPAAGYDTHDHIWYDIAPGHHTLIFIADPGNDIAEFDEENNRISRSFVVEECPSDQPDLTISNIQILDLDFNPASQVCVGAYYEVSAIAANIGTTSSGGFSVRWWETGYGLAEVREQGSLAPNEVRQVTARFGFPQAGEYSIELTIDHDGQVTESNEGNNTDLLSFTVESCPGTPAPTPSPTTTPTPSPTASPTSSPTSTPTQTATPSPTSTSTVPPQGNYLHYFALGDSIASGHGLWDDGSDCRRSSRSYPYQVLSKLDSAYPNTTPVLHHFACSGAKAAQPARMDDDFQWLRNQVEAARVKILQFSVDQPNQPILVTITIGANDFNWLEFDPQKAEDSGFYQLLQVNDEQLAEWINERTARVEAEVADAIAALAAYPNVRIVVTEVANPLNRQSVVFAAIDRVIPGLCSVTDCYAKTELAVHELNAALADAVSAYGQPLRVSSTIGLHRAFHGHESLCGTIVPLGGTWFQFPFDQNSNSIPGIGGDCVHPNHAGAHQYAEAIMLALSHLEGLRPGDVNSISRTWDWADSPVATGQASRTWMWGPSSNSVPRAEEYDSSPAGRRLVQYFDKSRMEISNPDGDPNSLWYVTNGLLVMELVTGRVQLGDNTFEQHEPARVNIAGDSDDPTGPTYATFNDLLGLGHPTGSTVMQRVDRDGNVSEDPSLAGYGVTAAQYVPETGHNVASVFWAFMNSTGVVYKDGHYVNDLLFPNAFYATGFPITEAFWARVKVAGTYKDVLMQCFERRCLTYTPDNPDGWKVEAGNVGQHYYSWRYETSPGGAPGGTEHETLQVDANNGAGSSSTFQVQQGDQISFSASGYWCTGGVKPDGSASCGGPEGIRSADPGETATLPSAQIGTLIANIGGKQWFAVGAGTTMTAATDGYIVLMVNDSGDTFSDNSGSVTVEITITRR